MNQNDVLNELYDMIQEELIYFYNHIRTYDAERSIDIIFSDNVYETALEYDMCDVHKTAVIKNGSELDNLNGTVILAPSKDKVTLVVLSKKTLPKRSVAEVRGTLIHELTHAHDYYDYAEFLEISDYNELFDSQYYNAFYYWTEFHARRIGYRRFIECIFEKEWKQLRKHRYELVDGIKANFLIYTDKGRVYDFMQASGRYCAFLELCSSYTPNFKEDILKDTVDSRLIDTLVEIYDFLSENQKFEDFVNNIATFDGLLEKIDLIVGA